MTNLNNDEQRMVDEAAALLVRATVAYANRNKCSVVAATDQTGDALAISATAAMDRIELIGEPSIGSSSSTRHHDQGAVLGASADKPAP